MKTTICGFLSVLGVLFCLEVYGLTPPPPLKDLLAPLPFEGEALARCLREGLPKDLPIAGKQRWESYELVARALVELNYMPGAQILAERLISPLPEQMQRDFDAFEGPPTPRMTDAQRARQAENDLLCLQIRCAEALGYLADASAAPPLRQFLNRMAAELRREDGLSNATVAYSHASIALAGIGDTAGIDTALELLARSPSAPWTFVNVLRVITGQTYGPELDAPPHMLARELPKWTAWWKENQASFRPVRSELRERNSKPYLAWFPADDSVLASLRQLAYGGHGGPFDPNAARDYLRKNASRVLDELRAVMNDAGQGRAVRQEAMRWYGRFGGKKAMKELERYVKGTVPFDPVDETVYHFDLCGTAFDVIHEADQKLASELAAWSIQHEGYVLPSLALETIAMEEPAKATVLAQNALTSKEPTLSGNAASFLMGQGAPGADIVAGKIKELEPFTQEMAIGAISSSGPAAVTILAETVKSPNFNVAFVAVSTIRRLGIAAALPPESRAVFDQHDADPKFRP